MCVGVGKVAGVSQPVTQFPKMGYERRSILSCHQACCARGPVDEAMRKTGCAIGASLPRLAVMPRNRLY